MHVGRPAGQGEGERAAGEQPAAVVAREVATASAAVPIDHAAPLHRPGQEHRAERLEQVPRPEADDLLPPRPMLANDRQPDQPDERRKRNGSKADEDWPSFWQNRVQRRLAGEVGFVGRFIAVRRVDPVPSLLRLCCDPFVGRQATPSPFPRPRRTSKAKAHGRSHPWESASASDARAV